MKRLIFTLAVLFSVTSVVNAQERGKLWAGGSIGFETSKVKDGDRHTSFNIIPEVGYFINDNWGVGMRFGYAHREFNDTGVNGKVKTDGFTVNPFARYSFLKGDIGCLFVDGGAGYSYLKNKTTDTKVHEFEVGFRPGVAIRVSDNIALTGKVGFLGYQYEKNGGRKTNTFGFDFDMSQVELGINIVF